MPRCDSRGPDRLKARPLTISGPRNQERARFPRANRAEGTGGASARAEVSGARLLSILNEKLAESDRCEDCTFPGPIHREA